MHFDCEIEKLNAKLNDKIAATKELSERNADLELQLEEERKKNTILCEENKSMNTSIRKLKIENTKLEAIRKNIMSTLETEVEAFPLQEKHAIPHTIITHEDPRSSQQQYYDQQES